MFTVEISVVVVSVRQTGKKNGVWCPDREIRCLDSLGRDLPVPCVSGHPCRHAWQELSFFGVSGHPTNVSRHDSG